MILFYFSPPSALDSKYIPNISYHLIAYYSSGTHISPLGSYNNSHLKKIFLNLNLAASLVPYSYGRQVFTGSSPCLVAQFIISKSTPV